MQSNLTQSFVIVGRVSRPFGIKGWNHLTSFTDPPENLLQYRPWALSGAHDDTTDWCVIDDFDIQLNGNNMVVCIENCNSRDDANKYVSKLIGVPREVLPSLRDDEHYWNDLIGIDVVNLEQEHLGVVHNVSWNGAHPILLVRDASELELMIPFVSEYVHNIDAGSTIQVSWDRDWV